MGHKDGIVLKTPVLCCRQIQDHFPVGAHLRCNGGRVNGIVFLYFVYHGAEIGLAVFQVGLASGLSAVPQDFYLVTLVPGDAPVGTKGGLGDHGIGRKGKGLSR